MSYQGNNSDITKKFATMQQSQVGREQLARMETALLQNLGVAMNDQNDAWIAVQDGIVEQEHEEFPPVPTQLLWMFDGIDRKEATKMMHEYAKTAVTARLAKPLRDAWERAQQAEDKATSLADRVERLLKQTSLDSHRIAAWKECAEHQYGLLRLQRGFDNADYPIEGALDSWAEGRHPCLKEPDDTDYTPRDNFTGAGEY